MAHRRFGHYELFKVNENLKLVNEIKEKKPDNLSSYSLNWIGLAIHLPNLEFNSEFIRLTFKGIDKDIEGAFQFKVIPSRDIFSYKSYSYINLDLI